jgi:ABC-type Mn2+/Zn2+ transport system permease subunit
MSLGAVLLSSSVQRGTTGGATYESILFGQILSVPVMDAAIAIGAAGVSVAVLWLIRRPLLLWSFDPTAAAAAGVPARALRLGLMVLLAVAIVTAMRLVGVVLASALLVLPGATALRLSERLSRVVALACVSGLVGLIGGVSAAIRLDWPAGATIVLALTALFAIASAWSAVGRRSFARSAAA